MGRDKRPGLHSLSWKTVAWELTWHRATIVGIARRNSFLIIAAFLVAAAFGFLGIPKIFDSTHAKNRSVAPSVAVPESPVQKPPVMQRLPGMQEPQVMKAPEPKQPEANQTKTEVQPSDDGSRTTAPRSLPPAQGSTYSTLQILRKITPEYTEQARRARVTGAVRLAFLVNTNGFPQKIRVIKGLGYGLNQKAIDALSHWRFKPVVRNGQAVISEAQADVQFLPPTVR